MFFLKTTLDFVYTRFILGLCQGDSGAPLWMDVCKKQEIDATEEDLSGEPQPSTSKGRKRCKKSKQMEKYTIIAVFTNNFDICGIASSYAVKVGEENVMNWIHENMEP